MRRKDRKEVVVVSRKYVDANKQSLRDYLLTAGYAEERDEFDDVLRKIREQKMSAFSPRPLKFEE